MSCESRLEEGREGDFRLMAHMVEVGRYFRVYINSRTIFATHRALLPDIVFEDEGRPAPKRKRGEKSAAVSAPIASVQPTTVTPSTESPNKKTKQVMPVTDGLPK